MACPVCANYGDYWEDQSGDSDYPDYRLVACRSCRGGDPLPREHKKENPELALEKAVEALEKQLKGWKEYVG